MKNDSTVLHVASHLGHADSVECIMQDGDVHPDVLNTEGWSALHIAFASGMINLITSLPP